LCFSVLNGTGDQMYYGQASSGLKAYQFVADSFEFQFRGQISCLMLFYDKTTIPIPMSYAATLCVDTVPRCELSVGFISTLSRYFIVNAKYLL